MKSDTLNRYQALAYEGRHCAMAPSDAIFLKMCKKKSAKNPAFLPQQFRCCKCSRVLSKKTISSELDRTI